MPRSYTNLIYHIVFSTKDRLPLITNEREQRLYEYIGGIIRGLGGILLSINGVEDHVHLLVKLRPDRAVADILRELKSNSSGWMHSVFPDLPNFSWQNGYGAFTVSESQIEKVANYIARQKSHHRKETFEREFVSMLEKNGIEIDMKYLWT
jgi:putative transposase